MGFTVFPCFLTGDVCLKDLETQRCDLKGLSVLVHSRGL